MLKITINIATNIFLVHIIHEQLHPSPSDHSVQILSKFLLKKISIFYPAKPMINLFLMEWICQFAKSKYIFGGQNSWLFRIKVNKSIEIGKFYYRFSII